MKKGGYREVLRMAYPLIISSGSVSAMHFCDRMFLAWYSADALRAALPASILAFSFECFFLGLVSYATTFVAQYYGARNYDGCGRATAQAFFLSVLSWPLMLMLIPVGLWLLRLSGHPPEVYALEKPYFTILLAGGVIHHIGMALVSFYTGRGKTLVTMLVHVIANAANIALNYALIFGAWGFPRMGIVGAGYATLLGMIAAPLILFFLYFSPSTRARYHTWQTFRFDWTLMKRMIRFGFPAAVTFSLDLISFSVFVLLLGRMSPLEHAAGNVVLSINLIAFMPMVGMGMAATTLVGQYQGRDDPETAERVGWNAMKMGLYYIGAVTLSFALFPAFYTSFFTDRGPDTAALSELLPMVKPLLYIIVFWGLSDGTCIIVSGALKGAGDTKFVMYFGVAMAWLFFVPGSLAIVVWLKKGAIWAWAWTGLYIFILAVGYVWRFAAGHWKDIDLLGRKPPVVPPPTPAGNGVITTVE